MQTRARELYPDACGVVRPPPVSQVNPGQAGLEGVWRIAFTGTDGPVEWVAALSKGLYEVGYRDPKGAWTMTGMFSTYAFAPEVNGGSVRFVEGGYEMNVGYAGQGSGMTGTWKRGDRSGPVNWSRLPAPKLSSVRIFSNWNNAQGAPVVDQVSLGERHARLLLPTAPGCGGMRGNCPRVDFVVYGQNLAAPIPVWLDPGAEMELLETRFLYGDNGHFTTGGAMKWIISGDPAVKAIRLNFAVRDGLRPGSYFLWLGDQVIPFDVVFADQPEPVSDERPVLSFVSSDGSFTWSRLPLGAPYRVKATFEKVIEDSSIPVTVGAAGATGQGTAVQAARQAGDGLVYLTGVLRAEGFGIPPVLDDPVTLRAEARSSFATVPIVSGATLSLIDEATGAAVTGGVLQCGAAFHFELRFDAAPANGAPPPLVLSTGTEPPVPVAWSSDARRKLAFRTESLAAGTPGATGRRSPLSRAVAVEPGAPLVARYEDANVIASSMHRVAADCGPDTLPRCADKTGPADLAMRRHWDETQSRSAWVLKSRDIPTEPMFRASYLGANRLETTADRVVDEIIEGRGPDATLRDLLPRLERLNPRLYSATQSCDEYLHPNLLSERAKLLERLAKRRAEIVETRNALEPLLLDDAEAFFRRMAEIPDYGMMDLPLDVPYQADMIVERAADLSEFVAYLARMREWAGPGLHDWASSGWATLGRTGNLVGTVTAYIGFFQTSANLGILLEQQASLQLPLDHFLRHREEHAYLESLIGYYDTALAAETAYTNSLESFFANICECE